MPGLPSPVPEHPEEPQEARQADRLLISARANARAYGSDRRVSASSTRIPRILFPMDCPALVAWK
jgi:hypothetical protein